MDSDAPTVRVGSARYRGRFVETLGTYLLLDEDARMVARSFKRLVCHIETQPPA